MAEATTIKVSKSIVELLDKLKVHPRQPYDEVIAKIIASHKASKIESVGKISGDITTIKLSKGNANRLSQLKVHPRQSYEEVVLALAREVKKQNEK